MEQLLGWSMLMSILLFILVWTKKHRYLFNILLIAFIVRAVPVILSQYDLLTLPDTTSDGWTFHSIATTISRVYGLSIIPNYFTINATENGYHDIAKVLSVFYSIFGESYMMASGVSVALGTASVYLIYRLSLMLWDQYSAKKAAWLAALFPSLILYSTVPLREVYSVFFLLIAIIGVVKFLNKNSFLSFIQIIFGFWAASEFHGPLIIGGFIFIAFVLINSIKKELFNLYRLKINWYFLLVIVSFFFTVVLYLFNFYEILYFGKFKDLSNIDLSLRLANVRIVGASEYPSWLILDKNFTLFPKIIIKIFYFLYSPFIWDIKIISHLIGLMDSFLYVVLTIYIFKNWREIWANPITRVLIIIFIGYIIIYGIGVGNVGTAIRHRSKFVFILIVLAAPKIHKFVFSIKNRIYNK